MSRLVWRVETIRGQIDRRLTAGLEARSNETSKKRRCGIVFDYGRIRFGSNLSSWMAWIDLFICSTCAVCFRLLSWSGSRSRSCADEIRYVGAL